VAGAPKTPRKKTAKAAGRKGAPRAKAGPPPAKTGASARKPARATARPVKQAAATGRRPPPQGVAPDALVAESRARQRRAGYALTVFGAAGIAGMGAWVAADRLHGVAQWALHAAVRGICIALIGVCLWVLLSQRCAVSRMLIVGVSALGLLTYEAGSAWWGGTAGNHANRILLQLESGKRDIESLAPAEMANPYIDAYVAMRDIYWELYVRSDDAMSRYRAYYEDYTAGGAFLDVERLATATDIWRSIFQIEDLQLRLLGVEAARPDISDLLLTVSLLDVDADTRAAYAEDVRAARDAFADATAASVARERETLRGMRRALEALLDAEGRYRIQDGRIIFQYPEDASRFADNAEAG